GHFRDLAALRRDERVLDVGCGIGRMARPLAGYLGPEGSYDGFDVNREGIAWCQERYAGHPNFRFTAVDLHNRRYNPQGAQAAAYDAVWVADAHRRHGLEVAAVHTGTWRGADGTSFQDLVVGRRA